MKFTVLFLTVWLFLFRVLLTVLAFHRANVGGFILGVISLVAIYTTVNAWRCGRPDLTPRGLCVGFLHLVPLCIVPGPSSLLWSSVFWALVSVQSYAKLSLAGRCTVTGPVFVDLCERGLYRLVRHPMTAAELGLGLSLIAANPVAWNLGMIPVLVASKVLLTLCEEGFLRQFPSYREYCERTPFRLIYGLW